MVYWNRCGIVAEPMAREGCVLLAAIICTLLVAASVHLGLLSLLHVLVMPPSAPARLIKEFETADYMIGRGIADVTGPVAEINMMGYVKPKQKTAGIHLRLYSRAFLVNQPATKRPVLFIVVDVAMIPQLLKMKLIERLREMYGDTYSDENVMLAATHTHSGPGGYMQYLMYQFTSWGHFKPSLQALLDGVLESIDKAHESLQPGEILYGTGQLKDASINRSPSAYANNPEEEKEIYGDDTDDEMIVLKLVDKEGKGLGMINWFAVHATSMNNTNQLISSDNKGYASILFEEEMNEGAFPGEGEFVAAFAQSNHGDVSPNTAGARCLDTGRPCDLQDTCGGSNQLCIASGPGRDMFESTRIIAEKQFKKAKEIYMSSKIKLAGPIDWRLQYVNMSNVEVTRGNTTVRTCKAAMGYSTAAGTTDGPGDVDFAQGDLRGDPMWDFVAGVIHAPSADLIACHFPKPILLPTGELDFPYQWQAEVVDFQVFRIGQLVIVGVPAELSTMSGRRLKTAVLKVLLGAGYPADTRVIITGLTNSYMNYVSTFEEYQVQRYEGASTMYGPHTLEAIIHIISQLTETMAKNQSVPKGSPPPNLESAQMDYNTPVVLDSAPMFRDIGQVIKDAYPAYQQGNTVLVKVQSGHPRNSDSRSHTYMTVERLESDGNWTVVLKDSHWDTRFHWVRTNSMLGQSEAELWWYIPAHAQPGTYRLTHAGHKKVLGLVTPYRAVSSAFTVSEADYYYDYS